MLRLCAAIALSLCVIGNAYGQQQTAPDPPVCDRTPQVRDEIVNRTGVSDCADVTSTHLATVPGLALSNAGITALKSDDFAGLTRNQFQLFLDDNQLQTLPADIFDDITSFGLLRLNINPFGAGLPSAVIERLKAITNNVYLELVFVQDILPASLELNVGDTMDVDLEDAFFFANGDVRDPADSYQITVADNSAATATVSGHTLTITAVSAGQTDIAVLGEARFIQPGASRFFQSTASQTVSVEVLPPPNPPVCDRTPQVRDEIVNRIVRSGYIARFSGVECRRHNGRGFGRRLFLCQRH